MELVEHIHLSPPALFFNTVSFFRVLQVPQAHLARVVKKVCVMGVQRFRLLRGVQPDVLPAHHLQGRDPLHEQVPAVPAHALPAQAAPLPAFVLGRVPLLLS